ncbi:MAG: outer membrane protein [Yoonia sp.]|jgi:outer membrane protein
MWMPPPPQQPKTDSPMFPLRTLTALLVLLLVSPANAETNSAAKLSLGHSIQLALGNNLSLEISRYNPKFSRNNLKLSLFAYDPSVSLSTDANTSSSPGGVDDQNRAFAGTETDSERYTAGLSGNAVTGLRYNLNANLSHRQGFNPGEFENTSGGGTFSITQPLLKNAWIDQTRLSIRVGRNDVRISDLALKQAIMQLVTNVERAYYDLILAQIRVQVQEQSLELSEKLLNANSRRVAVGVMAPLDEKQTESQVAARQSSLRSAQQSLIAQEYGFKRLITSDIATWRTVDIEPTDQLVAVPQEFDLHRSWGIALRSRPDILQAQINVESDGIRLRFRKNQLFPQLDLTASAGFSGNDREYAGVFTDVFDRDSPRYAVGARMSIPLGNRSQRKLYQNQRMRNDRNVLSLKEMEQNIMTTVALNIESAKTALDQISTTKKSREFAEIALDAEQKKLEIGKSTSFIVLQLQRDLTSARSAEITALAGYNRALSTLALSEGTTLERLKLDLAIK